MDNETKQNEAFTNENGNVQKSFTAEQSSQIREIEYDAKTLELKVEFSAGGKYRYFDVPGDVFQGALDAQSIGSFHAKNIKRAFEFEKIPDEVPST